MLFRTLKNNAVFFIPYLSILLIVVPVLILYPKPRIHLWINHYHSGFFDGFFRYVTFLGDGIFIMAAALVMLFVSLRHFLFILSAYLTTGLFAQVLKRVFFEHVVRPSKYFHDFSSLYLVDGVKLLGGRSFPSGHAASAFALFLCLALITKNHSIKLLCFFLACLVAFSRVYLSQHFLIDIVAGSVIGSAGALAFYRVFYTADRNWYAWNPQKLFEHAEKA